MPKEKKGLPTSVRLKQDLQEKLLQFMKEENRDFPNALDELLRRAFGEKDKSQKEMEELKNTLQYTVDKLHAIEKLEHDPSILTKKNKKAGNQ